MSALNVDRELIIKADLEDTGNPAAIVRFRVTDTWKDIQELLAKSRDLPIRRPLRPEAFEYHLEAVLPPGLQPPQQSHDSAGDAAEEPSVCLVRGPPPLQVTDEASWQRMQRMLPGSRADLAAWQLKASAFEAKSASYVRHLEGYTGMWQIAIMTSGAAPSTTTGTSATTGGPLSINNRNRAASGGGSTDGAGGGVGGTSAAVGGGGGDLEGARGTPLDGVWSEEEVALLARCLAEFMRKAHLERVGAVASGCCSLATLWWLLRQPNARVRPSTALSGPRTMVSEAASGEPGAQQRAGPGVGEGTGLDSGHDPGGAQGGTTATAGSAPPTQMQQQQQQQQQPATVFRLQLRKKDRGARAVGGLDSRGGGGGGGTGSNNTLLAVLLSQNLLVGSGPGPANSGLTGGVSRAVSVMMRDILNRVATTGPALLRQYKGNQVALAGVWGVGLLTELFRNPLLREELMVAAQLGAGQALAAAAGSSATAGGALMVGVVGGPQKRRTALVGDAGGGGGLTIAEGRRVGASSMSVTLGTPSGSNLLGINLEEVHWLLLSFAALPEWLEGRSSPPWDLQPMPRTQAAMVIQSSIRGMAVRREMEKLRSQVSRVFSSFRVAAGSPPVSRAPSAAIAALQRGQSSIRRQPVAPTGAQAAQPAAPAANAPLRPSGLSLKWEGDLARMSASAFDSIDRYFDLPTGSHPGVAAAEALLALLVTGGPLAREHFAASVHPGQLIRMLDTATVPPRVVHLGAVLLALALRPGLGAEAFIKGAGAAAAAASPGPPGSSLGPCFAAAPDRTMLAAVSSGGLSLVLELLRWLAPLTALEAHERRLRYGASERRTYQALRSTARPYAPPPLVDWRWAGSGSEVSVHAASAAWALSGQLAKLWAVEAAVKRQGANRAVQRQQSAVGGGWSGGGAAAGGGGGGGGGGYYTARADAAGMTSGAGIVSSSMPISSAAFQTNVAATAAAYTSALDSARAAAAPHDAYEEAAYRLMSMTVTCLVSGRVGPAAHLLACGLVQLVSEPAAVPYMVRAGLVDAGQRLPDPPRTPTGTGTGTGTGMPLEGGGATATVAAASTELKQMPSFRRMPSKPTPSMTRSQQSDEGAIPDGAGGAAETGGSEREGTQPHRQPRTSTSLPGFAGVAPHLRGIVGLLIDSDVAGFLDLALSIIGLVAQHGTPYDPVKGGLPGFGVASSADAGTGAASSWGPALPSTATGAGGGGGAATTATAATTAAAAYNVRGLAMSFDGSGLISFPVPELDHADIPARRLLMAGAWGSVCACLASGGGMSQTIPDTAAAALMFLAKEVYLWSEVLTVQAARRTAAEVAARAAAEAAPRRRRHRVRLMGTTSASSAGGGGGGLGTGRSSGSYAPASTGSDSARGYRETDTSPGDGEDPLGLDPDLPCPLEVAALLRLLMGDDFRTLTAALQALTQLLGRLHGRPLQYACLTAYHLAGVALLRNPLGKAGIVAGLVGVMRRWYDLPPSEQRAFRATGEWAMAALVRLTADPGGERNRYRLASAHRDESPAAAAAAGQGVNAVKGFFSGFGYATAYVPGVVPVKRSGRTGDELVRGMKWGGGWGWGSGPGGSSGRGVEAAKAAARVAVPDDDDELARELVANGAAPRSASDPIGLLVQLTSLRSRSRSSYVHIKMPSLLLLRQFAGERQYRVRLVTEGAGTALAAVANDSAYDGLTRAAAAALWMEVSQTPEGRDTLWWSAMAEQQQEREELLLLDEDDGFGPDGEITTRVTVAAVASSGANGGGAAAAPSSGTSMGGGEPARLRALSRMIGSMLSSTEAEQQLVGARAAAGLLCEGDNAKAIYLAAGGLGALLAVASRPLVQPGVLAAVCTALLNLSSYVPTQIDMCQRCARLLLHINAKYTGYHGYLIAQRGLAAAAEEAAAAAAAAATEDENDATTPIPDVPPPRYRRSSTGGSVLSFGFGYGYNQGPVSGSESRSGSPDRRRASSTSGAGTASSVATEEVALPPSIKPESLGAVEEILYSTSGALYNLSRHPGNRDAFYRLELIVRTRGAVAELAAETAAKPPPISGMSRQHAAAALLSGELRGDMPLPSPPRRRGGVSVRGGNSGRSDSGADGSGSDHDSGGDGGAGGPATAVWSISSASPFVPYHLRDEVVRYVSYTSYLQEVLSRPLHAPNWGGGGGGGGGSTWGGDDSRSQASARTGGGSSSVYSSVGPGGSQVGRSRSASGEDTDTERFRAGSVAGSTTRGGRDDRFGADDEDDDDGASSHQQLHSGNGMGLHDPAFPRLATLRQHMARPLTTMWAPLLVDRHNGVAVPLFGLRDAVTGELLDSGTTSRPTKQPTRHQPRHPAVVTLPHQQHHQTHRFYSQQQQTGSRSMLPESAFGGGAASTAGGQSMAGGGGATSSVSTATTITHLPAPQSATRWSPAVRRLKPVGEASEAENPASVQSEGAAGSSPHEAAPPSTPTSAAPAPAAAEPNGDGGLTVRVEFEASGPHATAAVIRNFRPTTAIQGHRASGNGGGSVTPKTPGDAVASPKASGASATATGRKSVGSSVTGLRRPAANARPSTAPPTRGAAASTAAAAAAASSARTSGVTSSRSPVQQRPPPLVPVMSGSASSLSLGLGIGGGREGKKGVGGGAGSGGAGSVASGDGDGDGGPSGAGAAAPAPSMVQQVASLVGSIDTSKVDRWGRELSFSLMSLPSSSLPSRTRSRAAGLFSWGGNALRQSAVMKNAEKSKKDVGSVSIRSRKSRALLSYPSFSAVSVLSTVTSAASASLAPSAASAHASSVFGLDGELNDGEEGDKGKRGADGRGGAGGRFGCKTAAGQQQIKDFQAPRVTVWSAVPGSKISDNLYPTYRLETGEPVHIYRRRKDRVDELRPTGLPQSSAPDATAGSYQREEAAAMDLLSKAGELPLEPDLPDLPEPPAPPRPDNPNLRHPADFTAVTACVTLQPRPGCEVSESGSLDDDPRSRGLSRSLTRFGPHSLVSIPTLPPGVVHPSGGRNTRSLSRLFSDCDAFVTFNSQAELELPRNIYLEALDEDGEGRSSIDGPGIELEVFDLDWSRSIVRPRLKHLITRNLPGGPVQLDELRSVLREHYWWLLLIFHHYAALYSPITADPFLMQSDAWAVLAEQTCLTVTLAPQRGGGSSEQQPPVGEARSAAGPGPEGLGMREGLVAGGEDSSGLGMIPGGRALGAGELHIMFMTAAASATGGFAAASAAAAAGGGRSAGGGAQKEGNKPVNLGAVSRPQWIELLMRAAAAKFLQPVEPASPAGSGGGAGPGGPGGATRRGSSRLLSSASSTSLSSGPLRRQPSRLAGTSFIRGGRGGPKAAAAAAAGANTNATATARSAAGNDGSVRLSPTPPQPSQPSALKTSAAGNGAARAMVSELNTVARSPRVAVATPFAAADTEGSSGGGGGVVGVKEEVGTSVGFVAGRQASVRWKLPGDSVNGDDDEAEREGRKRTGGVSWAPTAATTIPATAGGVSATAVSTGATAGASSPGEGSGGELQHGSGVGVQGDSKSGPEEGPEDEGFSKDLVSAVRRLLYECFLPNVAPGALVEPNNFREARLCQPEVIRWFQQQEPLLKALFIHYRDVGRSSGTTMPGSVNVTVSGTVTMSGAAPAGPDRRRLELSSWLELVGEGRLFSAHFTVREARLVFMASRARYVDELAAANGELVDPTRSRGLTYIAFLEALGRSAELISPPPAWELAKLGFTGEAAAAAYYAAARLDPSVLLPPRRSAHLHTPKTRSLVDKLNQVLSILLHNLMDLMGCKTGEQLLAKLRQPRARAPRPKRSGVSLALLMGL